MKAEDFIAIKYSPQWQEHVPFSDAQRYHARNVARVKQAAAEYQEKNRPLRILAIHGSGRSAPT